VKRLFRGGVFLSAVLLLGAVLSACSTPSEDVYANPDGTLTRIAAGDPPPAPIIYVGSSAGEPLGVQIESDAPDPAAAGKDAAPPSDTLVVKRLVLRKRAPSPADIAAGEPTASIEPETKSGGAPIAYKEAAPEPVIVEAAAAAEPDAPAPIAPVPSMKPEPPKPDPAPETPAPQPEIDAKASWLSAIFSLAIPPTEECWWSESGPAVKSLSPDTLFFCGVIDEATVSAARAAILASERAPKRVIIASAGGKKVWPIELARLLMEQGLDEIVVAGPCFSGCAHFVFPAMPKRYVLPEGTLGLHNTASSIEQMIAVRDRKSLSLPENQAIGERAQTELELVSGMGVRNPRRFLTDAQAMLDTACMDSVGIDRTGEEIYAYQSSYTIWVPPPQQWADWGVPYQQVSAASGREPARTELSDLQVTYAPLDRRTVTLFWNSLTPPCTP